MKDLVGDSSFYICFLDDIRCPADLKVILNNFTAHLSPKVHKEVSQSDNYKLLKGSCTLNIFEDSILELGEIVKPFFSKDEVVKGEHEVVVVAYLVYNINRNLVIIIDESGPRIFLQDNFTYMKPFLRGTLGFVGECYYEYGIMDKEKSLNLLEQIEKSKFRAKADLYKKVRAKINST